MLRRKSQLYSKTKRLWKGFDFVISFYEQINKKAILTGLAIFAIFCLFSIGFVDKSKVYLARATGVNYTADFSNVIYKDKTNTNAYWDTSNQQISLFPQYQAANTNPASGWGGLNITALAGGGYAIVSGGSGPGDPSGIYMQIFDSSGNKVGSQIQVNTSVGFSKSNSYVAELAGGGFAVSWSEDTNSWGDASIFMQQLDSAGNKVGPERRIDSTDGFHHRSRIIPLTGGGYVIYWEDDLLHIPWLNYRFITARQFDAAGNPITGWFMVNTFGPDNQYEPDGIALSDGGYLIIWDSADSQDGDGSGIFAQRFDSLSNKVCQDGTDILNCPDDSNDANGKEPEFRINTYASGDQGHPKIAVLSGGGFVITWQSYNQDGDDYGIYVQQYDSNCGSVGLEKLVNTYTTGSQSNQAVAGLAGGGYSVAWQSAGQDGDGSGIFYQQYDSSGDPVGGETQANEDPQGDQQSPQIIGISDGGYIISWQHINVWSMPYFVKVDPTSVKVSSDNNMSQAPMGWPPYLNLSLVSLSGGGFVSAYYNGDIKCGQYLNSGAFAWSSYEPSPQTAQFKKISAWQMNDIDQATLNVTQTLNGQTIDYYLSNNNGITWESVAPGVPYSFVNPYGDRLLLKAVLTSGNSSQTPTIDSVSLNYNYQNFYNYIDYEVDNQDPTCSDIIGNPYCTIQAAVNAISNPADAPYVINVHSGTYNSFSITDIVTSATNTITIQENPGDTVIISDTTDPIILVRGTYITIDGFEVMHPAPSSNWCINNDQTGGSPTEYITYQNLTVHNCDRCIGMRMGTGLVNHLTLLNSTIYDCGDGGFSDDWGGVGYSTVNNNTFYNIADSAVFFTGPGCVVTNNIIYNSEGGIGAVGTVANNIVHDCTGSGSNLSPIGILGAAAQIYNNVVYGCKTGIWDFSHSTIRNNLVFNNDHGIGARDLFAIGVDTKIINNTVVDNKCVGMIIIGSSDLLQPNLIKNNIIANNGGVSCGVAGYENQGGITFLSSGGPATYATYSYNQFYNNGLAGDTHVTTGDAEGANPSQYFRTIAEIEGSAVSGNTFDHVYIDDPYFINPADPDGADNIFWTADDGYNVQLGSPAIDAGDPADAFANEPVPNGGKINLGMNGNTSLAELSVPMPYIRNL